ncbi:hypothetical protein LZ24_00177 [Desulfobotulus alkaliphilus]|uniref:Uncharacterized protein n=1 Tax=Desulfobotulus alkaliphilus TaxID=622671 RepID=A0A562S7U0_9BACT|nr:hypothetical protein [Desulfobotulus alkaliphilus]TWI77368.1 hypothetical protein LZ24_00177 [Desulfobotulus alkaliphilus]
MAIPEGKRQITAIVTPEAHRKLRIIGAIHGFPNAGETVMALVDFYEKNSQDNPGGITLTANGPALGQ